MSLWVSSLLLSSLAWGPAQSAEATAPAQTAAEPAGRRFVLQEPVPMHFVVDTNVGKVQGTVDVVRIDTQGIEGWGRFVLRMTLDPSSVRTGDRLRDKHIAEFVLSQSAGSLQVASTDRLASLPAEGGGWILGASTWMDAKRNRKHLDLRYLWKGKTDGGVLEFEHIAGLNELGLREPKHPFVEVTGPVKLQFKASLVRPN